MYGKNECAFIDSRTILFKNGVPIEEDNTYDYASRYSLRVSDAEHRYYIQRGEQTAALNFDREPRFYSTLGFDRGKWYGNSYKTCRMMMQNACILKIVSRSFFRWKPGAL